MSTQAKQVTRESDKNIELKDDLQLLDIMLTDSRSQPSRYQPGPYWATAARNTANEIKRCGIADFRGSTNLIGLGYTDVFYLDIRNAYNHGFRRLAQWLTKTYPLSRIFDSQVRWTESYATANTVLVQDLLKMNEKTRKLLQKYVVPYSLLGKCRTRVEINGHEYSIHYLSRLEQHHNIASSIRFKDAYSIFEIGGGFGTNVHLLLENYKNIRKVLYLDIPPNLYVGTQYLKAFYGPAVFDYRFLKDRDSLRFSPDDKLEILCIAPWQIEKFDSAIDVFMNSNSFVEMPYSVVKNYAERFSRFPGSTNAAVGLTTYSVTHDGFEPGTTLDPSELPKAFNDRKFDSFEVEDLLNPSRKNRYFVSPGKLSFQSK